MHRETLDVWVGFYNQIYRHKFNPKKFNKYTHFRQIYQECESRLL